MSGQTINILFGFSVEKVEEAITKELIASGYKVNSTSRTTKVTIKAYIIEHPELDIVILKEYLDEGDGKYTARELTEITDKSNIRIIYVLEPHHRGKAEMKELFCNGVLDCYFSDGKVGARAGKLANLVLHGRTRGAAKEYYKITEYQPDHDLLTYDEYLDCYTYLADKRYGMNLIDRFVTVSRWLSPPQMASFINTLPDKVREILLKYSEYYDIHHKLYRMGLVSNKLKKPRGAKQGLSSERINKQIENKINGKVRDSKPLLVPVSSENAIPDQQGESDLGLEDITEDVAEYNSAYDDYNPYDDDPSMSPLEYARMKRKKKRDERAKKRRMEKAKKDEFEESFDNDDPGVTLKAQRVSIDEVEQGSSYINETSADRSNIGYIRQPVAQPQSYMQTNSYVQTESVHNMPVERQGYGQNYVAANSGSNASFNNVSVPVYEQRSVHDSQMTVPQNYYNEANMAAATNPQQETITEQNQTPLSSDDVLRQYLESANNANVKADIPSDNTNNAKVEDTVLDDKNMDTESYEEEVLGTGGSDGFNISGGIDMPGAFFDDLLGGMSIADMIADDSVPEINEKKPVRTKKNSSEVLQKKKPVKTDSLKATKSKADDNVDLSKLSVDELIKMYSA